MSNKTTICLIDFLPHVHDPLGIRKKEREKQKAGLTNVWFDSHVNQEMAFSGRANLKQYFTKTVTYTAVVAAAATAAVVVTCMVERT